MDDHDYDELLAAAEEALASPNPVTTKRQKIPRRPLKMRRKKLPKWLKGMACCYILNLPDGTKYIGSTAQPHTRIRSHEKIRPHSWVDVDIVCAGTLEYVREVERKLIKANYGPNLLNRYINALPTLAEFTGVNYHTLRDRIKRGIPLFEALDPIPPPPRCAMELTIDGVTMPVSHWAKKYGLSYQIVMRRMRVNGLTPLQALTTPPDSRRKF